MPRFGRLPRVGNFIVRDKVFGGNSTLVRIGPFATCGTQKSSQSSHPCKVGRARGAMA
jgi:hypothetical protein